MENGMPAIAEYLLVIRPTEPVRNAIKDITRSFAEKFDYPSVARDHTDIVLVRFQQYVMAEPRIVHRLELVTRSFAPFALELQDFSSLPSHSIHINVSTKNQVIALVRNLRQVQPLMKIDKDRKPHFITDPHISIIRKLLPWQYEKGWHELSHTHFSARFITDHLLLLKKGEGKIKYDMLKKCMLQNVKEVITQGQLFNMR